MKGFIEVFMIPDEEGTMLRICIDISLIMMVFEDPNNLGVLEIYRPKTEETELLQTGSSYSSIIQELDRFEQVEVK